MSTETPAAKVIRLLGAKKIAHRCNLTTNAVWKWDAPGKGYIPAPHQRTILVLAQEQGVALAADDIIAQAA